MEQNESCNDNCSSCGEDCESRKHNPADLMEQQNACSNVKKVIGVVSGKGGVGKSLVTALLASKFNKKYKTAILDADITGPSIPKMFGITGKVDSSEFGIYPAKTKEGLTIMSTNLLLENESDPVIWRGPMISGMVKQLWTDVMWGDIDYMFVDMPPGTSDVALTVFQTLPVDGLIIVTSPQDLVSMIVGKAVKMANMLKIPVLGLVENMSYLECPDCGKKINVFGESKIEETARKYYLKVLDKLPINPKIATAADAGTIETLADDYLQNAQEVIENSANRIINIFAHTMNMKIAAPSESGQIAEHFGKTKQFVITTVKEGRTVEKNILDLETAGHDALAIALVKNEVTALICSGIGDQAKKALNAAGVTIVSGAHGEIDQAVTNYILGKLKDDPKAGCAGGDCGENGDCSGCH